MGSPIQTNYGKRLPGGILLLHAHLQERRFSKDRDTSSSAMRYIIFKHYGVCWPDLFRPRSGLLSVHELLVTLRCCCGPSHPLVSLPSETIHPHIHRVVPSHYSTVTSSREELQASSVTPWISNQVETWSF